MTSLRWSAWLLVTLCGQCVSLTPASCGGPPAPRLVVLGGAAGVPWAAVAANGQSINTSQELRRRLSALRSASDWEEAHGLLWWSLREAPTLTRPIHCNIVLASLSESAQWQLALVLLEHMATVGIERDGYSFSAAIGACARAHEPEHAVATFKVALRRKTHHTGTLGKPTQPPVTRADATKHSLSHAHCRRYSPR